MQSKVPMSLWAFLALGLASPPLMGQHQANSAAATLTVDGRSEDGFGEALPHNLIIGEEVHIAVQAFSAQPVAVLVGVAREPGFALANGLLNLDGARVLLLGETDALGDFLWTGTVPEMPPGTEATLQAFVLYETGPWPTAPETVRFRTSPLTFALDQELAGPADPIQVSWDVGHEFAGPDDWVAIFRRNSTSGVFFDWARTDGDLQGTRTLQAPLGPGEYEVRYLRNNGLEVLGEPLPFSVLTFEVTPAQEVASTGVPLDVDWRVLDRLAQPDDELALWRIDPQPVLVEVRATGGATEGSAAFDLSNAGVYEVRYQRVDGTPLASSAAIDVYQVELHASRSMVRLGDPLTVEWTAQGPLDALDWIGVVPLGEPGEAFVAWLRPGTSGGGSATVVLEGVEPGLYEFRYFPMNGMVDVARSDPFLVRDVGSRIHHQSLSR